MVRWGLRSFIALWIGTVVAFAAQASKPWLSQPSISPDGREIAFVSGGDVWTVPAAGGEAHILVSGPSDEQRPMWSPDGNRIAFVSDRTGNGDIYVLTLATGDLQRITYDDGFEMLDSWSPDGKWLYFESNSQDISGMEDVFRVRSTGGTPAAVSSERYTQEFEAAPSPDGRSLLLVARGIAASQWWRHGHSHIDETEIWLQPSVGEPTYRKIVPESSKCLWPMWAPDGSHFYFSSDQSGVENIWSSDLDGNEKKVSRLESGRLLWPAISRDGSTIVFEHDFAIWRLDPKTGESKAVPIELRGSPAEAATKHETFTKDLSEAVISPDGKKVAFVVHGEIFAASAKDGGDAMRVTRTETPEYHVTWAPDSKRIAYIGDRDGSANLFLYDFVTQKETRLTSDPKPDMHPEFSPDGKEIAFVRGGRELRVIDPATLKERLLATAEIDIEVPLEATRPLAWSPDGKWIAYMASGDKLFRNAWVVNTTGDPKPVQVSFVANVGNDTVSWSSDGEFLAFDTGQRTEAGNVARVDLVPRTPKFREQQFRDLFEEKTSPESEASKSNKKGEAKETKQTETEKAAKPVRIVTDGIRRRLSLLPLAVDVAQQSISPDGKTLLVTAEAEGATNLYVFPLDELSTEPRVAKQITSTSGRKSFAQWSADGKTIWYLEGGRIHSVPADGGRSSSLDVSAEMDVSFTAEKAEIFRESWTWLDEHFHDPKMNGVDWKKVHETFAPYVEGTKTKSELIRLLSMMVGELDASHSGVRSGERPSRVTGRLGLRFDRAELESSGRFKVSEIVSLSPAALSGSIHVGDYLLAVDGTRLDADSNLNSLLENTIGKEVKLTIASDASGKNSRNVDVKPVDLGTAKHLVYRDWVEGNREYVARISHGRLGYVHMADMSYGALLQLAADLDAENQGREGVVVDIRNNNGGFVNAYALDVLSRRHYLNMTFRGFPTVAARAVLGQRALEKPTVLITNQHSLSDAEDFTQGYRAMGLGKTVGEPTAGWIIYTSNVRMIDGTVVRLPFITVTTATGEPMEMHPRPVDVSVMRPLGETAEGKDSQLDAAVRTLLAQMGSR